MKPALFCIALLCVAGILPAAEPAPDYATEIQPLLTKYCAGCHQPGEENGEFALHNFESLMRGGASGLVIQPRQVEASRLIQVIEGTAEPKMPPEDEPQPSAADLATLKAWIDSGAAGPSTNGRVELAVPSITPTAPVREPARSAAWSADETRVAVGRDAAIDLYNVDTETLKLQKRITGPLGQVNAIFFLNGSQLLTAGGEPGLPGEIALWNSQTGENLWRKPTHSDVITTAAVSPDGGTLATGSYDQTIELWNLAEGARTNVFKGHNGPIFGLAFHPTQPWLASASGDRTIKLWNTQNGKRLDTLNDPTKDQAAITFTADGERLIAVGADSRIRLWTLTDGSAGSTTIETSHFAHEGGIVALGYEPQSDLLLTASDDGWLKRWKLPELIQQENPVRQSDWVNRIAVAPHSGRVLLARLDGSIGLTTAAPETKKTPADSTVASAPFRNPSLTSGSGAFSFASLAVDSTRLTPLVAPSPELQTSVTAEREPNATPAAANPLSLPGRVAGRLQRASESDSEDADLYRFTARQGETWVFEVPAGKSGGADTVLDLLKESGEPVERLLLRATRDSAINFRGIAADRPGVRVDFWEEMELNEYLYLSGEVCRIFRMPQGPDSDMLMYAIGGKRQSYFETTGVAHALGEPVYVVEPLPPGTATTPNGLPTFTLYYQNDDNVEGDPAIDSRLTFTVPEDGTYLLRVRDVRGFNSENFDYTLVARRAMPDFAVKVVENELKVPPGSGQTITLRAARHDGFDGAIGVAFGHLPDGFAASGPVVIEAGHSEAKAVLTASADAKTPSAADWAQVTAVASALIHGQPVTHAVRPPKTVSVAETAKLTVQLIPDGSGDEPGGGDEIVIRPGGRVRATLKMQRHDFDGEMKFEIENMPHGVIVDHIGLSGILVREGETDRRIEFHCAEWVAPTEHLIFAVSDGAGKQASAPVRLRVAGKTQLAQQP